MSNKKTLEQMSTTEATRAGITSLADRPNDKSRYGDGGLSATMLKERFDALPNLVREKFNKIAEMLAGTDAAKYITLDDERLGETLYDFLLLFGPRGDGITDKNISDYIETLYQGEGDEGASSRTLKDIVASICARLVDLRNFAGRAVGDFSLWVDEEGRMIVDAIDLTGDAFKLNAIDPIGKAGIRDGAVGFEKLDSELGERVNRAFTKARYTASDGKLHFDSADGVELDSIDLPLESIIVSGTFDTSTKDLVFTLVGGGALRIPFDAYIEAVASDVARLDAKTDKSFKTATLAGDDTLVLETHDGSVSTVDLSTVALDGQTRDTIARLEKNDADHEHRISNIEEHISDDYFVTDDNVAYKKAVPARACTYAKLARFGGMSHKSKNHIPILPYANKTVNGVTFTLDEDGVYHLSGTPTATTSAVIPIKLPAGKYTLSLNHNKQIGETAYGAVYVAARSADSDWRLINGTHSEDAYQTATLTVDIVDVLFAIMEGVNCDGLTIAPMLNEGDYIPYEPYYEGLRDSKVTEIKNHGTNLLPYPYYQKNITSNGITFTDNGDGSITLNGTATGNAVLYLSRDVKIGKLIAGETYIPSLSVPSTLLSKVILMCNYVDSDGVGKSFTTSQVGARVYPSTVKTDTIYLLVLPDTTLDNVIVYPMINEGSTVAPFKPYREPISYPIPAEIQALEGYGKDGFNINLEKQEYTYGGVTLALPARLEPIIKVEGGGSLEFVNEYKNPVPSAVKYLLREESAV